LLASLAQRLQNTTIAVAAAKFVLTMGEVDQSALAAFFLPSPALP
jgi:hypothetical protein